MGSMFRIFRSRSINPSIRRSIRRACAGVVAHAAFAPAVVAGVLLVAVAVPSWAQTSTARATVAGAVVDPLGNPVSHAVVTLLQDGLERAVATTGAAGTFRFDAVAPGRYRVRVVATPFNPVTSDEVFADPQGTPRLRVSLQLGVREDVVVTASATALPASQVGAPVTVIDRDDLDRMARVDLLGALATVPSVQVAQTGERGDSASLFIRGGASNFNKVLIDGVPANDIGGFYDFSAIASTGVDRVEVLRDANSVLYGSDALAGVVDITTRRGTTRVPQASFGGEVGTLGTARGDASFGGVVGRLDYFSELSRFGTDNNVPNDVYRDTAYAGRFGGVLGGRATVSATVRANDSRIGQPNAVALYGLADDSSARDRSIDSGVTMNVQAGDRWEATARFGVMTHRFQFLNPTPTGEPFDPFGYGANYLGDTVTVSGANGYSVTGRAILDFGGAYPQAYVQKTRRETVSGQATYHAARALDVSAGAHVDHEYGSTDAGSAASATRTNGGAFAEMRVAVGRTFATAGIGLEHNAVFRYAATPRVSVATYLRAASATEAVGSTKLTFNAGTGIKAPSISQELSSLYAVVQGVPGLASPGLSPIGPERSRSTDIGVEQGFWGERVKARAALFDNRFSDLIEFVSNTALPTLGIPVDVASATPYGAYVNSSSYYARGAELATEVKVSDALQVAASYTYLAAAVTRSFSSDALAPSVNPAFPGIEIGVYAPLVGGRPFRRPANSGSVTVSYGRGPVALGLSAAFSGKADDSTYLSDPYFGSSMLLPNKGLNPAYQRVDLTGSYRLAAGVRTYVAIGNLLDESYSSVFGYRALPRTIRVGATLTVGGDR